MRSAIKACLRRLVPEKVRLLRYGWYEMLRYYPELVRSLGSRLECPFCQWHFRRFRPAGFDYPVLRDKQVVGASWHPNDVCPRCMSNARERLVYMYLRSKTAVFKERLRLLHIAPEPQLERALRQLATIDYVTADLVETSVDVKLDVMMLPFADASFDLIICNHVLEHVRDDRAAMTELHRVLRPGRQAILQVPIALALQDTLEDPSASTEAERIRMFGQRDHVRLYAAGDYMNRLRSAGFFVSLSRALDCLGEDAVGRHALLGEEPVFSCRSSDGKRSA